METLGAVKTLSVTILTGFLGSGKTTLINHLLKSNNEEKIAIIENEFGEINIDGSLLYDGGNTTIIELNNGCICCSIRGELTAALHEIIDKIDDKINNLDINRIILETTGLADPAPIVQTFFVDEILRNRLMLDSVVATIDTAHILRQLNDHHVAAQQIGFADLMILTKTDLITEEEKKNILHRINSINKKADIIEANNGKIEANQWIGINGFTLNEHLKINNIIYRTTKTKERSYNDNIKSYVFEAEELDIKKIGEFMEDMIDKYGNDMLRYKGILAVNNDDRSLIVQGVHKVVGFDFGTTFKEQRKSVLIVIARNFPYYELKERFNKTAMNY